MKLAYVLALVCVANALDSVDCNEIFNKRKLELSAQISAIDEAKRDLEQIRAQNERDIAAKRKDLEMALAQIKKQKDELEALRAQITKEKKKNEEILAAIENKKSNKVVDLYAKMKPAPAASVLENMKAQEAAFILYALEPKTTAAILAKMQPANAAKITEILKKGPPFSE